MAVAGGIELRLRTEHDAVVLEVDGAATFRQAPVLREELFAAIARAERPHLVVDLEGVEEIDTVAMAVLVEGLIATRESGPEIFLCSPSRSVRKVFRLAGLDDALARCWGCRAEAERAIAEKHAVG